MKYKLNQTGIAHIAILGLIVIVVGAIGFAGYRVLKNDKADDTSTETSTVTSIMSIESEPAGISIAGNPACDSVTLSQKTPYNCEIDFEISETILTAPADAEIDGKKYTFSTWDGCSESNPDKKICKVKLEHGKYVRAVYNEKIASTSQNQQPTKTVCDQNKETDSTATCVLNLSSQFSLRGFPSTATGRNSNGDITWTIGGDVHIICDQPEACSFRGEAFSDKIFNRDTFNEGGYGDGSLVVGISKPTNVTITIPKTFNTSTPPPLYCKACSGSTTHHVFSKWGLSDLSGTKNVTTYFISNAAQ